MEKGSAKDINEYWNTFIEPHLPKDIDSVIKAILKADQVFSKEEIVVLKDEHNKERRNKTTNILNVSNDIIVYDLIKEQKERSDSSEIK